MGTFVFMYVLAFCLVARSAGQTLVGVSAADGSVEVTSGFLNLVENTEKTLLFYGADLNIASEIGFSPSISDCDTLIDSTPIVAESPNLVSITKIFSLEVVSSGVPLYVCIDNAPSGFDGGIIVTSEPTGLIPFWLTIVLLCFLLVLSGLFSGLNLGLMALDIGELKVFETTGNKNEQGYAKTIMPLRKRGNLLLCTLLLGNVLVNNTLTILLDGVAGGLAAILGATAGIVVFGEIVPQSVCTRHGLWVGAKTINITKFFMAITFPVAYPISLILDKVLGQELGSVLQRKQLLQLVRLQDQYNDLAKDEFDIVTGALTYREKNVKLIMTPIEDVFMLDIESTLDFKTMTRIIESGHSRIPTYRNTRDEIVGILYVKDLAFIDPDDKTPLETVIKYYNHRLQEVYSDTKLDKMLDQFKQGLTHICLVIEIVDPPEGGDPRREVVGIVTLEDIIEEIIQDEIIDETDVVADNRTKSIVMREKTIPVMPRHITGHVHERVSEQMLQAVLTYLSTSCEPFSPDYLPQNVLRQLLSRAHVLEFDEDDLESPERVIYSAGRVSNVFSIVLEGEFKVVAGIDKLTYSAGPFHVFGSSALMDRSKHFQADFTVRTSTEKAKVLQIPRSVYVEALNASRRNLSGSNPNIARGENSFKLSPLHEVSEPTPTDAAVATATVTSTTTSGDAADTSINIQASSQDVPDFTTSQV